MAAATDWNFNAILADSQIIPHVANTYTKAQIRSAIEVLKSEIKLYNQFLKVYGLANNAESKNFFSLHCSCLGIQHSVTV